MAAASDDLWGDLPCELASKIFTYLPVSGILRSRAISRHHRSWIGSLQFLGEYSATPPRSAWLLCFPGPGVVCAYDPSLRMWFDLPCEALRECRPLASARGLVCVAPKKPVDKGGEFDRTSSELLVCNPVTGSSLQIPHPREFARFFFLAAGMIVSENKQSFRIVVAGSELIADSSTSFSLSASVFDSETRTWSKGGSTTVTAPISTCKAMSEGGELFVVVAALELVAYNEGERRWSRVNLPVRGLTSIKLVDRLGKLVLVGRTEEDRISLWELRSRRNSEWTELDTMPGVRRCGLLQHDEMPLDSGV